jgi:hypothetical protein
MIHGDLKTLGRSGYAVRKQNSAQIILLNGLIALDREPMIPITVLSFSACRLPHEGIEVWCTSLQLTVV